MAVGRTITKIAVINSGPNIHGRGRGVMVAAPQPAIRPRIRIAVVNMIDAGNFISTLMRLFSGGVNSTGWDQVIC
jgi:hypothetical protein